MRYSTSPPSSTPDIYESQDLPHLTAVARIKIIHESRKSDHDLRHWVGHANFLDHLTRPSTISANQQKIFAQGFAAAATFKSSEAGVDVVEVDDDLKWAKSIPQPRRRAPDAPKVSVVHCEDADEDEDEEDDLAMLSRTIMSHGQVKLVPSR